MSGEEMGPKSISLLSWMKNRRANNSCKEFNF